MATSQSYSIKLGRSQDRPYTASPRNPERWGDPFEGDIGLLVMIPKEENQAP